MPEHNATATVVAEKMLPYPDTCIVENLRKIGTEQDMRPQRISLEKIHTETSKRRPSLPVLPFAPKETKSKSSPVTRLVENPRMNGVERDLSQPRISLERFSTKMSQRRESLPALPSSIILSPKENRPGLLPASCLVENLRMNGAEQDQRQRRISLERINNQMSRRKQSLPVLPSYLVIVSPTKEKQQSLNKDGKDVTFQLPVGVLMEQVVTEGEVEELKDLLAKHGNKLVDVRERSGVPPILRAILEDHIDCLKVLLAAGANILAKDAEEWNAFHIASAMDNIMAAKMILEAGERHKGMTQSKNIDGERAIDLAESLEMARLLLHADLAEFRHDCSAVGEHTSYTENNEAEVLQLVKQCYDTHLTSKALNEVLNENTCYSSLLHLAATKNYSRLADYVCSHWVPTLEEKDKNGCTPLQTAAYYNNINMALFLVERGANIHAINHLHQTPSDLTQHELIVSLMKEEQVLTA